jgi:trans-aconitate methyltransferase
MKDAMSQPCTELSAVDVPSSTWNAELYDGKHSFVWKFGASLIELLAPRPGERILDLGCGTGHLTAQLAAAGADVVGLDAAPSMIEQASQAYPNLSFEIVDARAFCFAEPFDAVFSNAALHWVKEPSPVLDCVYRVLKPGGRFAAEFGGRENITAIVAALDKVCRTTGIAFELPWYFPSIGEYVALLERAGLEVTFATLFDRSTPLEGEAGMRDWFAMFLSDLLSRVPPERRHAFLELIERELRPELYRDGAWHADYRRLRVAARRVR